MAKQKVVQASKQALDMMKYEIAAELGLPVGKQAMSAMGADVEFATELGSISAGSMKEDYWGHIASRDAGAVGGTITKRLIQKAEEALFSLS
ncbi:alpha/beta-type small acid-soluble spore protein [Paenibacillus contaminans]|uniref:Small acid-soluble spore protein n=1 Tax=Paenibacillus contaminans TaxID=450362 RepID=A0A329MBB5_9BACL|nr:alpha/beta-type small acid-soluble spore protein [Paenibacillus contaminans]RAV17385.1 small acid-soluble spore protein [Paenibacillus contaminans]